MWPSPRPKPRIVPDRDRMGDEAGLGEPVVELEAGRLEGELGGLGGA